MLLYRTVVLYMQPVQYCTLLHTGVHSVSQKVSRMDPKTSRVTPIRVVSTLCMLWLNENRSQEREACCVYDTTQTKRW